MYDKARRWHAAARLGVPSLGRAFVYVLPGTILAGAEPGLAAAAANGREGIVNVQIQTDGEVSCHATCLVLEGGAATAVDPNGADAVGPRERRAYRAISRNLGARWAGVADSGRFNVKSPADGKGCCLPAVLVFQIARLAGGTAWALRLMRAAGRDPARLATAYHRVFQAMLGGASCGRLCDRSCAEALRFLLDPRPPSLSVYRGPRPKLAGDDDEQFVERVG